MNEPVIPMLPPKVFWDIIAASERPTMGDRLAKLHGLLVTLTPDEVVGFDNRLWSFLAEANRSDLLAAARLLAEYVDRTDFLHFGCWLVLQGRAGYEAALADPDTLADIAGRDPAVFYEAEG